MDKQSATTRSDPHMAREQAGVDERPPLAVAHVVLRTHCMQESAHFMRTIGMRPVFEGPEVSVFELRGGTHLLLMSASEGNAGPAPFDLMVDDLHATHARFEALGLAPSPIESRPAIHHELFTVREPSGCDISIFSSHAGQRPV